jgi:putative transposase
VTAGTYLKAHVFSGPDRLAFLQDRLFEFAEEYGWRLQAWALFSNHYHFVGMSPEDAGSLKTLIHRLHGVTAREMNRMDGVQGRKVWFEYWETRLTFERSYLARLKYVHENPAHHGVVQVASSYLWCSSAWFERKADPAFAKTVMSFRTDQVNVPDPYEVNTDV